MTRTHRSGIHIMHLHDSCRQRHLDFHTPNALSQELLVFLWALLYALSCCDAGCKIGIINHDLIGNLKILWMVPKKHPDFNISTSIGPMAMALKRIRDEQMLPVYDGFDVTWIDSECNSQKSVGRFTEYIMSNGNADVIIGPPCSSVYVFYSISETFKWTRAAILYVNDVPSIQTLALTMISQFIKDKAYDLVKQYPVSAASTRKELNAIFILIMVPRRQLRMYMLAFHDYGLTNGEYQFLFTEIDLDEVNVLTRGMIWRGDDGRNDDARSAFGSLLYFTFVYVSDHRWTGMMEAYEEMFPKSTAPKPVVPDRHSTFLYDAMLLYAAVVNDTIANGKTPNGTEIFKAVQYKRRFGTSGEVFMNGVGDRFPSFVVWDLAPDGNFQKVLTLNFSATAPGSHAKYNKTVLRYHEIIWGDGRTSAEYIPLDVPVCGFFNELCPEDTTTTLILASTISVAAALVIIIGLFINSASGSDCVSNEGESSAVDTSHSSVLGSFGSVMKGSSLNDTKTLLARYRSTIVVVKSIRKDKIKLDRHILAHLRELFSVKHPNLATLIGMCLETDNINVLWEYCIKGSIQDLVSNSMQIKLDGAFQFSIANDICRGLAFIHGGPMKYHGNLKSTNCVIDNHWACKLTDFGMEPLRLGQSLEEHVTETDEYSKLFWMAPELLRHHLLRMPYILTQQADIYALGIVLKELLCLNTPYSEEHNLTPKAIVQLVAHPTDRLMRPMIQDLQDDYASIRNGFKKLICSCWAEDPLNRPVVKKIIGTIKQLSPYKSSTVLDNMFMMMERHSNRLEEMVMERTANLEDEKKKTEALLYRMLPKTVADELKLGKHVKAEYYDSVTVYFSDIVGFTSLASQCTPMQIVDFLNSLYSLFDDIIQKYDVYKVETIGDAYMVASGLPLRNGEKHVTEMADVSLNLLQCVLNYQIPHLPSRQLQIRIGLQSGPAVAGVVGLTMPRYCLFGDTVNTASRMESNGRRKRTNLIY
ncbi:atrial natriuretic peptide receptor 1-like [Gigantopelta aegis]|uniref:atrial natriuretic peptide receptor 1-like n=1 Tax=Gigantopelta aegis TaxID=1735272 RepID=UPI001B8879DE|nr:atrial natriuretic peptide receptor 1-like [Gigantopelta aegis]